MWNFCGNIFFTARYFKITPEKTQCVKNYVFLILKFKLILTVRLMLYCGVIRSSDNTSNICMIMIKNNNCRLFPLILYNPNSRNVGTFFKFE